VELDVDIYVMRQWACSCADGGHPCPVSLVSAVIPAANETGYNMTTLLQDEWHYDIIDTEYGMAYYKFELQADPAMPCPMIHVDKEVETGTLSAFVNIGSIPSAASRLWYSPYFGYSSVTICPMHPSFAYGTYYITLVNQRSSSMNSFRIRFRVQNSPSCLASYTEPFPAPSNHTAWLQDGIPHVSALNYPDLDFFSFQSRSQCTNLSISINKNQASGDLDLYVSTKNQYPQFNNPASHQWHSTVDGDDRVNIAYCDPDPGATSSVFYIGVRAAVVGLAPYTIVATVQQWAEAYPYTELSYNQARYDLLYGASPFMNCSSGQVFTCGFPTYSLCFNDGFDCCYRFSHITPTKKVQGLWPWSEADSEIGDTQWTIPWRDVEMTEPGKLAWALKVSASTPENFESYTFGDIGACSVTLGNTLVSRSYNPLSPQVLNFTPKPTYCDNAAFSAAKAKVDQLSASLLSSSSAFSGLALQQLRLAISSIDPAIRGCEGFVDRLVEHVTVQDKYGDNTNCYQPRGSSSWTSDPCCNGGLQQCCAPRPFLVQRSSPSSALSDTITTQCRTPECSKASVKSWIDSVNRAGSVVDGCDRIVNQASSLDSLASFSSFINTCRQNVVGDDLLGVRCELDSECLSGATCQPITRRCNHTDDHVVNCLVSTMPLSVSRILYDTWGLTEAVTPGVLATQLKSRVFFQQCIGPSARRYLPGYHWQVQVAGCTDQCSADAADPYCFDRSCPVPEYCDGASGTGACYRFYGPTLNDTMGCLDDTFCNWKRCIPGEPDYANCMASCVSGSADVCIDCSGEYCKEVASITDATRCGQGLCSVDEAETSSSGCSAKGICSAPCPTCNTEIGCQAHGSCNEAALIPQGSEQGGYCLVPPVYDADSDSFKCSDSETMTLTVIGCVFTNMTEVECDGMTGTTWRDYAISQPTCTSPMGCYDSTTGEREHLTMTQCNLCGGKTWKSHFTWSSSATWRPGRMQSLVWTTRAINPTNTVGYALSYTKLMEVVNEAITSQYAYAYRTQALCRLDAPLRLIGSAACDCNEVGGNEVDTSQCFESISDSQVGSGLGCAFLRSEIDTPVGALSISNTSYPASLCSPIGLYFTPASQYELSQTFNQAVFRSSAVNSFWIVKNGNEAAIGQIVSGAIRVELSTTLTTPATLCIHIDTSLSVDKTAVIWSLALLDEDETVRAFPSTSAAYLDGNNRVCGPITSSGSYFATKLVEDYEERQLRTKSETAQYRSAAVLFGLCALFGIIQGILLFSNRLEEKILSKKMVFIAIIVVNCIIRAVFVSLPANAFKPSAAAGQFVVFELPSFLFFSVFTTIIYLWLMVIAKTGVLGNRKAMKTRRKIMFRTYLAINLLMYLVFIIFIILIAILPKLQEKSPCFLGSASSDATGSNVSYTIKLAYWIFQFIVSVAVGLAFLVAAFMLLRLMSHSQGVRSKKGSSSKPLIIITSVAVVCSIVILIRSSVFLWSAKTGHAVNVLVFAFLEIIPQAFLLFYLHPFRIFREATTNSTHNSKGSAEFQMNSGARSSTRSKGTTKSPAISSEGHAETLPRAKPTANTSNANGPTSTASASPALADRNGGGRKKKTTKRTGAKRAAASSTPIEPTDEPEVTLQPIDAQSPNTRRKPKSSSTGAAKKTKVENTNPFIEDS
jgi:hypothetical protein